MDLARRLFFFFSSFFLIVLCRELVYKSSWTRWKYRNGSSAGGNQRDSTDQAEIHQQKVGDVVSGCAKRHCYVCHGHGARRALLGEAAGDGRDGAGVSQGFAMRKSCNLHQQPARGWSRIAPLSWAASSLPHARCSQSLLRQQLHKRHK